MAEYDLVYTIDEVADMLNLRRETVAKIIKEKKIKAFKTHPNRGGLYRISGKELKRFISNMSNVTNKPNTKNNDDNYSPW